MGELLTLGASVFGPYGGVELSHAWSLTLVCVRCGLEFPAWVYSLGWFRVSGFGFCDKMLEV